jgi:hypothetical protein
LFTWPFGLENGDMAFLILFPLLQNSVCLLLPNGFEVAIFSEFQFSFGVQSFQKALLLK